MSRSILRGDGEERDAPVLLTGCATQAAFLLLISLHTPFFCDAAGSIARSFKETTTCGLPTTNVRFRHSEPIPRENRQQLPAQISAGQSWSVPTEWPSSRA